MKHKRIKFGFSIIGIFILVGLAYFLFSQKGVEDAKTIQLISSDPYQPKSYLVYTDEAGKFIGKDSFSKGKGVGVSGVKQVGNQVYFDSYPSQSTVSSYSYERHSLDNLGTVAGQYDIINPYSESLVAILNHGYTELGYGSGICYLASEWICHINNDGDFRIVNGVVFKEKLYVHTLASFLEVNPEEKIKVYDMSFNLLDEVNVSDLGLNVSNVTFYPYNNRLYLLGSARYTNYFSIIQMNEALEVVETIDYPGLTTEERTFSSDYSYFEQSKGKLYVELKYEKETDSVQYVEDNVLLKLDFDALNDERFEFMEIGNSSVRGINFETDTIFIQPRKESGSPINHISLYTTDFEFKEVIEIEQFNQQSPTLVDHIES